MSNAITVYEAKKAKEELAKKIDTLLHEFVKQTGIIPCAEITAVTEEKLSNGRMKRVDVNFKINLKVWI